MTSILQRVNAFLSALPMFGTLLNARQQAPQPQGAGAMPVPPAINPEFMGCSHMARSLFCMV
jgi:hypothetical protein